MEKIDYGKPCSPYLLRPLRSLDQALKDQAMDVKFGRPTPLEEPQRPTPLAAMEKGPAE